MSKIPKSTFTATGVWSHMKPGQRATTLKFAEPAPKNETPQQKVKRLREAANQAKMAQITRWDYMYLYGRIAADTAHRLTVYGIVFATGCLGVLAFSSIADMIVYNRRRRAIYLEDLEIEQAKILELARRSVMEGTATPAQIALVEGIAEEEELMQKKIAERKAPSRLLWWMHGEWKEEKALEEQRKLAVEDFKRKEAEAASLSMGVTHAVQDARSNTGAGGPLDQQAENATQLVEEKAQKGWFGWAFGSKKE